MRIPYFQAPFCCDEGNVYVPSEVDRQNTRYCSQSNPGRIDPTKEQGTARITVWGGNVEGSDDWPFLRPDDSDRDCISERASQKSITQCPDLRRRFFCGVPTRWWSCRLQLGS
ncbi:hypothetical protein PR048_020415 [Dryococelus australis]|uniref:Uncharacterized protein n=1 Tax=Dryococelus australis TaxID=614101 RepID=A0ABQ9H6C7_9NEOP|nr:hypothetical protein PR048_020415 [Dryococelus australis]